MWHEQNTKTKSHCSVTLNCVLTGQKHVWDLEMSSEESFYLLRHWIKVNVIETGSRRQAWHGAHLKEMYNSVYKKKETF